MAPTHLGQCEEVLCLLLHPPLQLLTDAVPRDVEEADLSARLVDLLHHQLRF